MSVTYNNLLFALAKDHIVALQVFIAYAQVAAITHKSLNLEGTFIVKNCHPIQRQHIKIKKSENMLFSITLF